MTAWQLYVGGFTGEFEYLSAPSEGIERFGFDDADGSLSYLDAVKGVTSPQYLRLHPSLPVLYAAEFCHPGRLTAFSIHPSGHLEPRSTFETLGELTVAVDVHPRGRHAYVANWGSGSLASLSLDAEGNIVGVRPINQLARRDGRSEAMHAGNPHQVRSTPSGNGIVATYAGLDEVTAYEVDEGGTVASLPIVRIEFPPGSAPRHIEYHPSGRLTYVVGELSSMVYVLEAEAGLPTRILNRHPTTPPDHSGPNSPTEFALHPDGHTLVVCNRGSDCLTILEVDDSGRVNSLHHQSCLGHMPRCLTFDPTGQFLVVGNSGSGDLVVFAVDRRRFEPVGPPVRTHAPSSLVFAGAEQTAV